ncbi:MAG TPA: hypothetical protein VGT41_00375 [Candidatus Babeliales bacterium]|nr:hypothetical protein [Candidatus Babeliales bacterium]
MSRPVGRADSGLIDQAAATPFFPQTHTNALQGYLDDLQRVDLEKDDAINRIENITRQAEQRFQDGQKTTANTLGVSALEAAREKQNLATQMPYFPDAQKEIIEEQIKKLEQTNVSGNELIQFINEANKIIDDAFEAGRAINNQEAIMQNLPTGAGSI